MRRNGTRERPSVLDRSWFDGYANAVVGGWRKWPSSGDPVRLNRGGQLMCLNVAIAKVQC